MLASITPLGERGRHNRWGVTAATLAVGAAAGGAALGAALGALGSLPWRAAGSGRAPMVGALALLAVAALLGLVADLGVARARLPTVHRQVDERWLDTYRGSVYGLGFGFQLGVGVVTTVTASITYVAFAAALLSGSWVGGLAVGVAFGAARGAPVLLTAPVRHPAALRALHRRRDRWAGRAHAAGLWAQAAGALAFALLALTA